MRNYDGTFTVTYAGIYYISAFADRSVESLGVLSERDMQIIINRFNHWVYEESLRTNNRISAKSIISEFSGVLGDRLILQLIRTLEKKGVLRKREAYYELVQ